MPSELPPRPPPRPLDASPSPPPPHHSLSGFAVNIPVCLLNLWRPLSDSLPAAPLITVLQLFLRNSFCLHTWADASSDVSGHKLLQQFPSRSVCLQPTIPRTKRYTAKGKLSQGFRASPLNFPIPCNKVSIPKSLCKFHTYHCLKTDC